MLRGSNSDAASRLLQLAGWLLPLSLWLAPAAAFGQELSQVLIQPNGSFHHQFGWAAAVDGTTMVSGDPEYIKEDQPCVKERGALEIYKKTNGTWTRAQFIRYAGDGTAVTRLGETVAIRNNVAIAATPGQAYVNGATSLSEAGALSVYRRPSATADFALVGYAFAPTPAAFGHFSRVFPSTTNGVYLAASGYPNKPSEVYVYRLGTSTVDYMATITTPLPLIQGLFITDQNVLVANAVGFPRPRAYALNGTQVTEIDTSGIGEPTTLTMTALAGSGNTIVFLRESVFSSTQEDVVIAKFGASAILSIQSITLPRNQASSDPVPIALAENQGLLLSDPNANYIAGYRYSGGSYNYAGVLLKSNTDANGVTVPFTVSSMAFNGTDLFIGDHSIDHQDPTQLCGSFGSIYVYQPMAASIAGPGVSRKLQPWLHKTAYANASSVATAGSFSASATAYTTQGGTISGGVTLFQNSGGTWQQVAEYLDGDNASMSQSQWTAFGAALDLSTSFIAIGAPFGVNPTNNLAGTGQVQVARLSSTIERGPNLTTLPSPASLNMGDMFGWSLSIAGNAMVVGAPAFGVSVPANRGSILAFDWNGTSWGSTEQVFDGAAGVADWEEFGYAVSASGNNLIVGIPGRSSSGRSQVGAVEIFTRTNNHYVLAGEFDAPSALTGSANFGSTVSIGADFAAAGSAMGTVVTYRRNGTMWLQDGVIAPGAVAFGSAVAIEGTRLIIGSPGENRVYRYDRSSTRANGTWGRTNFLPGPALSVSFGSALDFSGGVVVIGDPSAAIGSTFNGASFTLNGTDIHP